jgi:NAD(P)H dehydrogenase (quinone)
MGKILITGVTGGLGNTVVELLSKQIEKSNIAVLVRDAGSDKAKELAAQGIEVRTGTYDDPSSLVSAFAGIDKLYFVSGNDLVARFKQHENVVTAAKEAGVRHILYTSTIRKDESDKSPLHTVVSAHVKTEEWIKAAGLTYTLLRHNLYAEVIPMFIGDKSKVLETKSIFLPAGDGKASLVVRHDFAEAAVNILVNSAKHENKIYHLSGSPAVNFTEVATIISSVTGEQISYAAPTAAIFEEALTGAGVPEGIVALLSNFSQGIALGEFDDHSSDLEQLLGRKPQTTAAFLQTVYA